MTFSCRSVRNDVPRRHLTRLLRVNLDYTVIGIICQSCCCVRAEPRVHLPSPRIGLRQNQRHCRGRRVKGADQPRTLFVDEAEGVQGRSSLTRRASWRSATCRNAGSSCVRSSSARTACRFPLIGGRAAGAGAKQAGQSATLPENSRGVPMLIPLPPVHTHLPQTDAPCPQHPAR